MQITPSLVYWITRLDPLNALGAWLVALSLLSMAMYAFGIFSSVLDTREESTQWARWQKFSLRLVPVSVLGGLILLLAPTTKEAAAILVIPALANSADVQGLGADLVTLAREWAQELQPK